MHQYIYKYTYLDSSFSEINWWFGDLVAQLYPTPATPWTIACQAPLSMGLARQEYPNWPCACLPSLWSALGLEAAPTLRSVSRSTHTLNPTAPPLPVLSSSSSKVQLSSATQSCLPLCDPMDCSTPGLPVHHQLQSLLKLTSIKLVMPSNHLILCCPLLPPSIFPSIRVFPNKGRANFSWNFSSKVQQISNYPPLPLPLNTWGAKQASNWFSDGKSMEDQKEKRKKKKNHTRTTLAVLSCRLWNIFEL